MEVYIENRKYYIYWRHLQAPKHTGKLRYSGPIRQQSETLCFIKNSETQQIEFEGRAVMSKKDTQYVKNTGRIRSLQRAISSLPKEQRKIIWNAYLNR